MRKIPTAAERAHWLAQVAQALDQAKSTVEAISPGIVSANSRAELLMRIESARHMARTLRLASERKAGRAPPPEWPNFPPADRDR